MKLIFALAFVLMIVIGTMIVESSYIVDVCGNTNWERLAQIGDWLSGHFAIFAFLAAAVAVYFQHLQIKKLTEAEGERVFSAKLDKIYSYIEMEKKYFPVKNSNWSSRNSEDFNNFISELESGNKYADPVKLKEILDLYDEIRQIIEKEGGRNKHIYLYVLKIELKKIKIQKLVRAYIYFKYYRYPKKPFNGNNSQSFGKDELAELHRLEIDELGMNEDKKLYKEFIQSGKTKEQGHENLALPGLNKFLESEKETSLFSELRKLVD